MQLPPSPSGAPRRGGLTPVPRPIARIKASPFIPLKDTVRGFVYEVESGTLREVAHVL